MSTSAGAAAATTSKKRPREDDVDIGFRTAVTDAFSGTSSIAAGSKMDRPSVSVFALTVLLSTIKNKPPKHARDVASFREHVVEPYLRGFVDNNISKPTIKNAIKLILKFAKAHIENSQDDIYATLKAISVDMGGNIKIDFSPFEFTPDESKYTPNEPCTTTMSYFSALKIVCLFIQKHPLFRFANLEAKEEYFDRLQDTAYANVMKDLKGNIDKKRQKLEKDQSKYDEGVLAFETQKSEIEKAIELTAQEINVNETKLQKAKASMSQFMDSIFSCIESDLQEEYENMKSANERQMKALTSKLEETIASKSQTKADMERDLRRVCDENKVKRESEAEALKRDADMIKLASSANHDEKQIRLKIKEAVEAYIETFQPIMDCMEDGSQPMKEILVVMKEMISSQEVIQDGLFAMKTSLESFLDASSVPPSS